MAITRAKTVNRSNTVRFAGIPHDVMKHTDWLELTPNAVVLLLQLARQYNGYNNGNLSAAWSLMRLRGFRSQTTLGKALSCLLKHRMILKTREGRFCNPGKQCALYALTWQKIDECKGKNLEVWPTQTPPRAFSLENKMLSPEFGVTHSINRSHKGEVS